MNDIRRHRIKERALNVTEKTTANINNNNNNNNNSSAALYKRSKSFAIPHSRTTTTTKTTQQQDNVNTPQMRYKRSNSASGALIRSKLSAASFSIKQIPIEDHDDDVTNITTSQITTSPITTPTNKGSASDEECSTTTTNARRMDKFESHRSRSQSLVPSAEILNKVKFHLFLFLVFSEFLILIIRKTESTFKIKYLYYCWGTFKYNIT